MDVEYENTVRHELVVLFDPDGIVSEVGYERTEIPSKRVYWQPGRRAPRERGRGVTSP